MYFCTVEQVDVCGAELSATSQAPVAKYFIRDFGKLIVMDPTALMSAVNKGPVAVGTDTLCHVAFILVAYCYKYCVCRCGCLSWGS